MISGIRACRSFDTEPSRIRMRHALGELFPRLGGRGGLVVGADGGGEIGVEVHCRAPAAHGRRYGRPARQASSLARQPGSRWITPGKFMNSARPIDLRVVRSRRSRSAASSRAPAVSRCVAGTQLESWTRRSMRGSPRRTPGNSGCPRRRCTLAISCGSQIAVVTPCGSTQRSNSGGVTSEDSTCRCVSMKPGTAMRPRASMLAPALVFAIGADDAVAAHRDIGLDQRAGDRGRAAGAPLTTRSAGSPPCPVRSFGRGRWPA